MQDERRKALRAHFQCPLTLWLADGSEQTILAHTSDIGLGGLSVILNECNFVGTKLHLQVILKDSPKPFRCSGRVVRSLKQAEKSFSVGIEFDGMDEEKKSHLIGFVPRPALNKPSPAVVN